MSEKECIECRATETPQWREIDGHDYCNACGIRLSRLKKRQRDLLESKIEAIEEMKSGEYKTIDNEITLLKKRMKRIQGSIEKNSVCKCHKSNIQLRRKVRNLDSRIKGITTQLKNISKKVYVQTPDDIDKLIESTKMLESTIWKRKTGTPFGGAEVVPNPSGYVHNTEPERPSKKEDSGYTVGKDLVKSLAEMFFKNLADRMVITQKEKKDDD